MTSLPLRRAVAALILSTALALPLSAPAGAAVFDPEHFTLANGMQVVVVSNHRAPVVTHMVWYRVGAMDEPPGRTGVAHLLEHLMFKGTKDHPDGEFSQIVARNGGRENAFTSQDFTGYFQSVAADRLELMMELESDRMINLVLSEDDIETERQVVLEERRSRIENDPSGRLSEQTSAVTYLNHPYRNPVIGWEHEIRLITRDDLAAFYRAWYAPNNAILVVVGDVEMAQVRPLAEKYYGRIPARPLPERIAWSEPPASAARDVTLRDEQVRQPSWSRRFPAPSYVYGNTGQVHALEVLAEIVGGGTTSRMYRGLVVEQGIAAGAGAWYSPAERGPTEFGFYGSPRPGGDLAAIEKATEAEIAALLEHGVTEDEVARAKRRMQAEAVYVRDSLRAPAQILGSRLVIGLGVEDIESWPERIAAVTVDDVNAAARAVLGNPGVVTARLLPAAGAGDGK